MEEDEGRKKKVSMEVELEQLERQRQEVRRNMDEIDRKMEQVIHDLIGYWEGKFRQH